MMEWMAWSDDHGAWGSFQFLYTLLQRSVRASVVEDVVFGYRNGKRTGVWLLLQCILLQHDRNDDEQIE